MTDDLNSLKKHLRDAINMDDTSFNEVRECAEVSKIKRGDFALEIGEKCNMIYFVADGIFRIFHLKDGIEVNTCFCSENSFVTSFDDFIKGSTSSKSIQAVEDSVVIGISRESLVKLESASSKWKELRKKLTEMECSRLSDHIDTLSFSTAKEKYESLLIRQKEVVKRVPIQYIASYLGISRETLSRIRSKVS